jgi:hypothetical protein
MPKYKIPPPKTTAIDKLEDGIGALQLLDASGIRGADADEDSDTLPNRFAVSAITQHLSRRAARL